MPVTLNLCETQPGTNQGSGDYQVQVEDLFVSNKLAEARRTQRERESGAGRFGGPPRRSTPTAPSVSAEDTSPLYTEPLVKSELNVSLDGSKDQRVFIRNNGLVHAIEMAYSNHHHLVLRPDDIWICLLTQFSIYVNKHAEELRETFVSHSGKKTLVVFGDGTFFTADYAGLSRQMSEKMRENINDPSIKDWITPSFSTTTELDITVSAVIMMATFQAYFTYVFALRCGIPQVTLEGSKQDWELLKQKIERFDEFGEEPKKWTTFLRPILDKFVEAFDVEADTTGVKLKEQQTFWSQVCHRAGGGSGPTYLCGWVTSFCLWDEDGNFRGEIGQYHPAVRRGSRPENEALSVWPAVDANRITKSVAEVPVIVDDNGDIHHTKMIAGIPGFTMKRKGLWVDGMNESTLSSIIGWAMFEVPAPDAA